MTRLRPLAAVLIACGAASLAACGGTATFGVVGALDAGGDAAESPGCTPETCSSSDDAGPGASDATPDSTLPSSGEDATTGGDDGSRGNDDGSTGADGANDSTAPVDSPSGGEDAADGSEDEADSGDHHEAGVDSGGHPADAGGDSGDRVTDAGGDSGDHVTDAGGDSGEHVTDAGSDSGEHAADAGKDAGPVTIPDGGLPPTPGQVSCGANASCDVSANKCCLLTDGGGDCVASSAACPTESATVTCNEASDCPGSQICCVTIDINTASATAACQAGPCGTPSGGGAQACRTDQECGASGTCVVQSCAGIPLELCGLADFFGFLQCTAE